MSDHITRQGKYHIIGFTVLEGSQGALECDSIVDDFAHLTVRVIRNVEASMGMEE